MPTPREADSEPSQESPGAPEHPVQNPRLQDAVSQTEPSTAASQLHVMERHEEYGWQKLVSNISHARTAWIVTAVALAGFAIASLLYCHAGSAMEMPVVRFNIEPRGKGVQTYLRQGSTVAVSPDGRRVVFSAVEGDRTQLWVRSLESPTAQPLAGTDGARYPSWSPDSSFIGFAADRKLKKIDVNGGAAPPLTDAPLTLAKSWLRRCSVN